MTSMDTDPFPTYYCHVFSRHIFFQDHQGKSRTTKYQNQMFLQNHAFQNVQNPELVLRWTTGTPPIFDAWENRCDSGSDVPFRDFPFNHPPTEATSIGYRVSQFLFPWEHQFLQFNHLIVKHGVQPHKIAIVPIVFPYFFHLTFGFSPAPLSTWVVPPWSPGAWAWAAAPAAWAASATWKRSRGMHGKIGF